MHLSAMDSLVSAVGLQEESEDNMNKKTIERMLPEAVSALKKAGQVYSLLNNQQEISKSYRSAISSFGAAVTMGSFRAAVAFFSKDAEKGESGISRSKLLSLMYYLYKWDSSGSGEWKTAEDVCKEVLCAPDEDVRIMEKEFLHASVAVKLAMNAFKLV